MKSSEEMAITFKFDSIKIEMDEEESKKFSEIEEMVKTIQEELTIPAIGVGVLVENRSPFIAVSGVRKQGNSTEVTRLDKWHIGSCTKSMTATLTALVISSGKYELSWDTPLSDIFEYQIHNDLKNITLKDLLSHRSGIKDPEEWGEVIQILNPLNGEVSKERAAVAKLFLQTEASYDRASATEAHYSNIGYVIVGTILEKITGKIWEQLISEEIFNPLGMNSAGFGIPQTLGLMDPDQPWGHSETLEPTTDSNALWIGPAGNVHCSLEDWLKYLKFHTYHTQKHHDFEMLYQLIENNSDLNAGGWMIGRVDGLNILQAFGSDGTYLAAFRIIPELKSIIVCVTNSPDSEKSIEKFGKILDLGMKIINKKLLKEQDNIDWVQKSFHGLF